MSGVLSQVWDVVTRAVQRGARAAVDDLVAAVADTVEPPLLVVAAVPRRNPVVALEILAKPPGTVLPLVFQ